MKFDDIDSSIPYGMVRTAKGRWQRITVELGVREGNHHVGTGLGGNNFQLVTLMSLQNKLIDDPNMTIAIKGNQLLWGCQWLNSAKLVDIRHELDTKFPSILEKHKYLTLSLQVLADHPESLREGFIKHQEHFPNLVRVLNGKPFNLDPNLSNVEKLLVAYVLCQDLAHDLDKGIRDKISPIALALIHLPPEIILLSVRRYVQIERLIGHNLDEHPDFVKVLNIVTRIVN